MVLKRIKILFYFGIWFMLINKNQKLITSLEVFELFECLICLFEFPKQKIVLEKEKGFRQKKICKGLNPTSSPARPNSQPTFLFLSETFSHSNSHPLSQ